MLYDFAEYKFYRLTPAELKIVMDILDEIKQSLNDYLKSNTSDFEDNITNKHIRVSSFRNTDDYTNLNICMIKPYMNDTGYIEMIKIFKTIMDANLIEVDINCDHNYTGVM